MPGDKFEFDSTINSVVSGEVRTQNFDDEVLRDAKIGPNLEDLKRQQLMYTLHSHSKAFATLDEPFGAVRGHEVKITLTIDRPYPPILRKAPYPASPRSKAALEEHIDLLTNMGIIRKVGANENVDVTTPVIIAWHNGKSRLVATLGRYTNRSG
ncbi:hypothetical protein PGTUg99_037703 [Puccinia graminis f. sp. tritici]|uniref:Uncharacterized protein n=1 Tax=Puccinia graminis f. sp. tritici TaxID=56615 RepID=A0A5B0SMC4_PUCGR|nr:hypothetical protein PGTUg99_037703 [Puccinia graminis f. sp. tritici]